MIMIVGAHPGRCRPGTHWCPSPKIGRECGKSAALLHGLSIILCTDLHRIVTRSRVGQVAKIGMAGSQKEAASDPHL
jgi:hypothetical protein